MNYNLSYEEIINRIGYFRNLKRMSARELGMQLGHSETYFYKVENGSIILNLPTFLEVLSILEVTTEEFFAIDIEDYKKDKEILDNFKKLNPDIKDKLLDLIKNIK